YSKNHASSYLVHHCRFPCGLCREGTDAYTFIDHVDNRAWYCRVDHWWGGNASVLSAKRRRAVSPRRFNRIYPRSDFGPLSLAQIPVARTTRLKSAERARPSLTRTWRWSDDTLFRCTLTWTGSLLG